MHADGKHANTDTIGTHICIQAYVQIHKEVLLQFAFFFSGLMTTILHGYYISEGRTHSSSTA